MNAMDDCLEYMDNVLDAYCIEDCYMGVSLPFLGYFVNLELLADDYLDLVVLYILVFI